MYPPLAQSGQYASIMSDRSTRAWPVYAARRWRPAPKGMNWAMPRHGRMHWRSNWNAGQYGACMRRDVISHKHSMPADRARCTTAK
jgi:hypothetical protein